jgi:uncharacterized protein (TIGR00661 family)
MKKCKVYLSDEGYGHIVRQRCVIAELLRVRPDLAIQVQTSVHLDAAMRMIPGVEFINKYNNITWDKHPGGSPDTTAIEQRYLDHQVQAEKMIEDELVDIQADFILSDFVYEAFRIGKLRGIPTFGVAHFTWDWFFSKMYPPPVSTQLIKFWMSCAGDAKRLYFPPFTPEEIIRFYGAKAMQVPLILHREIERKNLNSQGKFKILIIDSGAGVLNDSVHAALTNIAGLNDYIFYVSSRHYREQENLRFIPETEMLADYVASMDLVIGRAGFNTISECIGMRTPMLLIGEAMNPEMTENITMLKKRHLGSFISLDTFEHGLGNFLKAFISQEFHLISQAMRSHDIPTNGAEVIVRNVLSFM